MRGNFFWLHTDWMNDRRVQKLTDRDFNRLFRLLFALSNSVTPPTDAQLSDALALMPRRLKAFQRRLIKAGLINTQWQLVNVDWFISHHDGGDGVQPQASAGPSHTVPPVTASTSSTHEGALS